MRRRLLCLLAVLGAMALVPSRSMAQSLSWSVTGSANVPGAVDNELWGISCTSQSFCMAAGAYDVGSSDSETLAEAWNGTRWTLVSSPNASSVNGFYGVSCASASFCVAVGWDQVGSGTSTTDLPLIETWNGSSWAIASAPAPAGEQLRGVSCPTSSFCVAVGGPGTAQASQTLIETWNGSSWTVGPSMANGSLGGVSCTSPSFCAAVGQGSSGPLVGTWNGGSWAITVAPGPSSAGLFGVSCASATFCAGVGHNPISGGIQTVVVTWNGSSWGLAAGTPDSGSVSELLGVSCASPDFCVAAGDGYSGTHSTTLIQTWDGTAWAVSPSPNGGAGDNQLNGAACVQGACFVAGWGSDANDATEQSLIEDAVLPSPVGPPAPGVAVPGFWKHEDQQLARADLRAVWPKALSDCTPLAFGAAGLASGVLFSALPGGSIVLTTSSGILLAVSNGPCGQDIVRITQDYFRATRDPPDQNYNTLANPAPVSPVRPHSCKRSNGGVRRFCKELAKAASNWALQAERIASIDEALVITRNREGTAVAADDQAAVTLQDNHIPVLEKQMAKALAAESADGRAIASLLRSHHIRYRVTKRQSRKVIAKVLELLRRRGITKAQLAALIPGAFNPRPFDILKAGV
ncbi:MAG TPA: hypothetical protein VKV27_00975 [Solirubrobacteraceae bacterium]|nr:hypothetical protein [Solirubrobacteraceae bacterium]